MAKRSRKKNSERKDFQKVKFKVGKQKPKGLNVTDTTFKSRAINIVEQFQAPKEGATSTRGRDIKQICSLLSHHATNQRVFAVTELTDYIEHHSSAVRTYLADILNAVLPRLMDDEPRIHTRIRTVLQSVFNALGEPSRNLLEPFATLIISYVICGLTHINTNVACNALTIVDILPIFLDLKVARDDSGKLLNALISMISTRNPQYNSCEHLNSVGYFATANARVLTFIRILHVLEAVCAVEEKERHVESVHWDIRRPVHFYLRHPLAIDLEPCAVMLNYQDVGSSDTGTDSLRDENIVTIMRRLILLVRIYWPTVADCSEDGDKTSSFLDLAGRRCCIDALRTVLRSLTDLYRSEELLRDGEMSNQLLKAIRLITEDRAVHDKPPIVKYAKDDFKHLRIFVERVISTNPTCRNFRIPLLFHQTICDLLKDYLEFVTVSGGGDVLLKKVQQELATEEKHRNVYSVKVASTEKHAAGLVTASFKFSQVPSLANLDIVDHDHCYFPVAN